MVADDMVYLHYSLLSDNFYHKARGMTCTNCQVSAAGYELINGLCHKCTAEFLQAVLDLKYDGYKDLLNGQKEIRLTIPSLNHIPFIGDLRTALELK